MKTISIIVITIILNACGGTKNVAAQDLASQSEASTNATVDKISMTQDQPLSLEYTAVTRGSYKMVKITQDSIAFKNSRTEALSTKACSKTNWELLNKLVAAIELDNMPNLEAPSKAHQYDGAPIGSLIINQNGERYQSQAFDAGNPHQDLKDLINQMLALTTEAKD